MHCKDTKEHTIPNTSNSQCNCMITINQKTFCNALEYIYTAGKISIERFNIFLSNYISDGAIDMKLSPDVGNNPSNPPIQRNLNLYVHKLSYM